MATSTAVVTEPEAARVDQAIVSMERLYRTVTGQNPPDSPETHAPIPVEKDPGQFVQDQLDRLLSLLDPQGIAMSAPTWNPLLSVSDDEREINIQIDLPGVERKDLEVLLDGNLLEVRGRRNLARDGRTLRLEERRWGPFSRRVFLPVTGRFGEPKAQLRDGVLYLRIEREGRGQTRPQQIPVL